ncbi:universal stress protein [Streptomyces mirabilis]|uniref:Universal stress protein n=1 Tax=Streptomyces mirabilis TaxID=68239 RepID=A0ABU3V542_9ACTN|nr:universal stress protein [Streptomyces mirabilis]MCX5355641.1 universal stress protein [Streptomyces mirabilis]MDU9001287.1 universal stress protein [Streptomyces mirabilis]
MFQRILVALDPRPSHESALRLAGGLARSAGAEVRVLHVVPSAVAGDTMVNLEDDAEGTALVANAVRMLQTMGINAEGRLAHGVTNLVPRLVSAAAAEYKADLLVLSPHHRGPFAALL